MNRNSLVSRLHQATILSCAFSVLGGSTLTAFADEQKATDPGAVSTPKATDAPSAVQNSASSAASAAVQAAASPSAVIAPTADPSSKVLLKPGQPLSLNMAAEDLVPTDNVELARQQALAYPDSAEAAFILAVAMSRTSKVEDALKEVRRARRLAEASGGAVYFDKMISSYEEMLKSYPDDNRVRYGLAWAYYMKAYLLAKKNPANPNVPAVSDNSPTSAPQAAGKQLKECLNNISRAIALRAVGN
ncbi:MAG: hypothetical protein HYX67_06610 [Candidatus Melainabacteria bacterium]|nr:hypothetical protein [Candidatus Melainabacteria bacterium]